jgi:superfamily II DNA or RNA helicase
MNRRFNNIDRDMEIARRESKVDAGVFSSTPSFSPSIASLNFPFDLKDDQLAAVDAWMANNNRGTILYSTGTGKTEIAFECAKRLAGRHLSHKSIDPVAKIGGSGNNDLILKKKERDISITKHI